MRELTLIRKPSTERGTFGELLEGSKHVCFTCERPWLDNQHKISCIPDGSYELVLTNTPHHGNVFEFQNVPDRDGVLVHAGNVYTDSEGCVLVGNTVADHIEAKGGLPGVTSSRATLELFMREYAPAKRIKINIVWQKEEGT